MGTYRILGGTPLRGELCIHGAKNSVLPILAATLATGQTSQLHGCPDISDVSVAVEILRQLGCRVTRNGECLTVDSSAADSCRIPSELMHKMRAAVLFLGALLVRFGEAELSLPGGCPLGQRPIDLHLSGLERLGVQVRMEDERIFCTAAKLRGATIALPFPSVGATENLLIAALGCEGETVLCNAAREPEIEDLARFLRACGACVCSDGGSVLRIIGRRALHSAQYCVMPDRMEAATYLFAAAATRGAVLLRNAEAGHLGAVLDVLRRAGCEVWTDSDGIFLRCSRLCSPGALRTAPYDGFPTDAQAPAMAAFATAQGVTLFEETIFSSRFAHTRALCAMGADIHVGSRCAVVRGVEKLHGARVEATDLRGGAASVIAALSAEGESTVEKTEHILRGYAEFVPMLRSCGAQITPGEG